MPKLFDKSLLNLSRIREWFQLVGITGGAQFLIQFIGLVSGIIIIRVLPTKEYALYTMANTMLGMMVVLADSGIASGVIAEGGKVWKDKEKMGVAINTGLDLRKKFAVGSLILALPILIYLLHYHGASWWMAAVIFLSLIPAFMSSLTGTLYQIPLKLKQDIKPLQKNILFENIGRFFLVLSIFLLPWTFIAILAAGIPRIYYNIKLKKITSKYTDWKQKTSVTVRRNILKMVKRIMPGSVYYVVSGQISIWLISIFGSTTNVAEIGALGRITVMLTIVSTIFGTLIYPRFARLPRDSKILMKRFFQVLGLLTLVCATIILGVWIFSNQILWVLGDGYLNLNYELVLIITASCIGLISGGTHALTSHRGWPIHPAISIPINIAAIIVGVLLMDISTLVGVLYFKIFIVVVSVSLGFIYGVIKISQNNRKLRWMEQE